MIEPHVRLTGKHLMHCTGANGYIELLHWGLRPSSVEVHLNATRVADLAAPRNSAESEWFHHSIRISGALIGQVGNRLLQFLRATGDDHYDANVIAHFKQDAR